MRSIYLALVVIAVVAPHIWGQDYVDQRLHHSILLEQQGQYAPAIHELESIANSNILSRVDQGRAWTLLGYAYEETGQFQLAEAAFEKALSTLAGDTQHPADLAHALDFSASLYQNIGQAKTAEKMWSKALAIYKQLEDHRGLAKTYANLAATEVEEKHNRAARAFFDKAVAEMTDDSPDDDRAFISDIQGWLDDKTGHTADAVGDYQRALALWKKSHGEQHPFTGWRYLLLGDAYAANGQLNEAVTTMRQGLEILDQTMGRHSPRYLAGEMMYSRVLDKHGERVEAAQLRTEATQHLSELYHSECIGCTVSVWSLR
jgi:tetratricopeptide (TPR) repeat protein